MTDDIVVGVDGSEGARTALDWALTEAARHSCAVRAVVGLGAGRPVGDATIAEQAAHMLHQTVTAALSAGARTPVTEEVVDRPGAEALLTIGHDARMIVVGARGRGLLHRLRVGSVSTSIAVHAQVPVVIARSGEPVAAPHQAPLPVVVGVDGSPNSLAALEWAGGEAQRRGVGLIAVYGWQAALPVPFAEAPAELTQVMADQAEIMVKDALVRVGPRLPAGLQVARRVMPCSPAQALLASGREAALLVVGARGHGGFTELLLGSVSHQCMIHSPVPVAIIRPR